MEHDGPASAPQPAPISTPQAATSSAVSTGQVIGITAGVAVAVGLAALLAVVIVRRHRLHGEQVLVVSTVSSPPRPVVAAPFVPLRETTAMYSGVSAAVMGNAAGVTTGHELTGGGMAISLTELLRGYRLTEAESEDGRHGLDAGEVEEWEDGEVQVGRSAWQLVGGRAGAPQGVCCGGGWFAAPWCGSATWSGWSGWRVRESSTVGVERFDRWVRGGRRERGVLWSNVRGYAVGGVGVR